MALLAAGSAVLAAAMPPQQREAGRLPPTNNGRMREDGELPQTNAATAATSAKASVSGDAAMAVAFMQRPVVEGLEMNGNTRLLLRIVRGLLRCLCEMIGG